MFTNVLFVHLSTMRASLACFLSWTILKEVQEDFATFRRALELFQIMFD